MTNIVQSLRLNLPIPPFDTVVHLGAGPYFTSDLYEQLSARQYVLVDADPQACENLRNSAPSDRYAVHTRFLCPESGKRSFHRYNLATLNSPLRPGPLAEIYPRLRDTETLEWEAFAIADFLKEITTSDQAANCLILDLPGQESELVASVTEEILHRFEWILVRGAGQLRMENAKPIEETTTLLTHVGFSCCDADPVHDSIYPLAAFHLDRNALQIRRLQDACMMLKAHVGELEAAKKETAQSFDQQLADLTGQLDARTQERDSLTSEKTAVHAQLSTLATERDQLKKTAGDHHNALASARQELEALKAQLAALASERDQLKKTAGDHHNALASARQELEALKSQFAETEKKRADLAGQLDARTKERDQSRLGLETLTKERDQLKKTVADRSSRIAELEAQTADQAERQIQIDEQMVRAEAQLEMLKDFMRPSFD
jgi:DNA repair exonuclease SbcCD ATPase subunit